MATPWWFCGGPGVQQVPMSLLERYWKKRDGCFAPRRSQPGWVATGILAFVFGTWNLGLFEILKSGLPAATKINLRCSPSDLKMMTFCSVLLFIKSVFTLAVFSYGNGLFLGVRDIGCQSDSINRS